jgi:hypothetical protein
MEKGTENLAKIMGKENEFLLKNELTILGRGDNIDYSKEFNGII